ncbi:MAG TPA: glycosyltransferase family 2 protein, partial [Hymenobacter sp.]
ALVPRRMSSTLFSIITVSFNDRVGLAKTMSSVRGQLETDYEYLVIDGGSTDGSLELLQEYAPSLSYWQSQPDGGTYDAMNKGIAQARGQYLLFLNSGDSLADTDILQKCAAHLHATPTADVLYGNAVVSGGLTGGQQALWKYPEELTLTFFLESTINHQAAFFRRTLFNELGNYAAADGLAADYGFFLRALLANKHYCYIDMAIVDYNLGGVSARDNFETYKKAMQAIWQSLVPAWAQRVVAENVRLADATAPRLVKLAGMINTKIKKVLKNQ